MKTETRFRESFSSLSLSNRIDLSSRIDRINRQEKSGRARELERLGAISRFDSGGKRPIGRGRSNSFRDFEINRLSLRDKYNGVNSISSLRFDCRCEIALLQWNFAIKKYKNTWEQNSVGTRNSRVYLWRVDAGKKEEGKKRKNDIGRGNWEFSRQWKRLHPFSNYRVETLYFPESTWNDLRSGHEARKWGKGK